jgi:uncharacterized protein YndB with AHSA1/START domain
MTSPDKPVTEICAILAEIEIIINASKAKVWKALTEDIAQWWPKEFFTSKNTIAFKVDLKLGGNMYEDFGDGAGMAWFSILGIYPEEMLYVTGHTRPPYGGPATGLITFAIEEKGENEVLFKVSDSSFGHLTENSIPSAQEGWKMIFTPMKLYCEKDQ